MAALLRSLGLSCTATARVLGTAEAHISQATVWRAVRGAGLREPSQPRRRMRMRVLEAGESPGDPGEGLVLRFLEDPDSGEKVGVEVWSHGDEVLPIELHDFVRSSGAELRAVKPEPVLSRAS